MKEPERLVGFIEYDDAEIAFEFDVDDFILNLYPAKELWKKYAQPSYIFGKCSIDIKKHEWTPENRICGKTCPGERVIFSVQGDGSSYEGFLSFQVNWYFCCFQEMDETRIFGFSIDGVVVDSFYSPLNALETQYKSDKMTVSSGESPIFDCGKYMITDIVEATITVEAYTTLVVGNYEHPIYASSRFSTEFSEPVAIDTVIKTFEYTFCFFLYVTYRANVGIRKANLFVLDEKGNRDYQGILVFPKREVEEKNKDAKRHRIVYSDLKEKTALIFDAIKNDHISLQHICANYDAVHSYPISRVIMILAAFERVYGHIYGIDTKRSEEYKEIKESVVAFIETLIEKNSGNRKRAAKELKKYVFNRDSSFSSNVEYALEDCVDIMKTFVEKWYEGEYDTIVGEISKRIGVVRNGVAHCRLDLKLEAIHLTDILIVEKLLYVMQLKHIGLTATECQTAIRRLFRD